MPNSQKQEPLFQLPATRSNVSKVDAIRQGMDFDLKSFEETMQEAVNRLMRAQNERMAFLIQLMEEGGENEAK